MTHTVGYVTSEGLRISEYWESWGEARTKTLEECRYKSPQIGPSRGVGKADEYNFDVQI